jgi:tetratricopeptide (TPR) repeat protein
MMTNQSLSECWHPAHHGARGSPCARLGCLILFMAVAAAALSGCATFGRRGPVPEDVTACRELTQQGVAAMEIGQWEKAELLLQRAVETSPVDSVTRRQLAEVLWRRNATDAALLQIEAAVRLDASDASLVVRCGEMLLATGATDKALQRAEEAIRHDPKLSAAWALHGRANWKLGETDRALADLQRALQYSPESPDVLMDVAALYRQLGRHDRCLTTLHHLLDTYPPGQQAQLAQWMEGLALADLGRPQQAADSLLAASRQAPPNADLLFNLAQAQLASGQRDDAVETVQQALSANAAHEPSRQLQLRLASQPMEKTLLR